MSKHDPTNAARQARHRDKRQQERFAAAAELAALRAEVAALKAKLAKLRKEKTLKPNKSK